MSKPTLIYTPFPKPTDNPYLSTNVRLLTELGYNVIAEPSSWLDRGKFMLKHLLARDIDSVVLNWHENLFRHRDGRVKWTGILVYLASIMLFRLMARRVIYVRHNLYPHAFTQRWKRSLAMWIVGMGQSLAHVKAAHSGHLNSKGFKYLPHTLYRTFSQNHISRVEMTDSLPTNYYVMFGFIERYKRIDEVVTHWSNEDWLVVAGNCKDDAYMALLKELAVGKRVYFLTRFIEEDEAQKIVGNSKGLIVAHADEDMIVSGSFFFGISVSTPILAVRTPFLEWFVKNNPGDCIDVSDSVESLLNSIQGARELSQCKNLSEIRALFSDERVKSAWLSLLQVPVVKPKNLIGERQDV